MNKKLIASLLTVSMAAGTAMQTPVQLMASTVPVSHQSMMTSQATEQVLESQGIVAFVFSQINQPQYAEYEKSFKVTGITGYENNGGQYSSSALKYAFDGNIKSHWETGRANNSQFKNEVIITFDNIETINRIAYAPRPGNKGHVQKMSIYASLTESGDDFELIASGNTDVRSSVSEFRFPNTAFKRLKFVFDQANQDWAAAGEFMFFKEDVVADKMEGLFIDSTKSQVSEMFNTPEKLEALEEEAKTHPFYEQYKEDLHNARIILENQDVHYADASVTKFDLSGETLKTYDELYKVHRNEIKSITNNGGGYVENVIERAIDGDINTKWHSNKQNSDDFKNEVVIELNELTTLNRVVYTAPRGTNRGFPERFDIYGSRTSKGDTFELVSSGSAQITQDSIEIKFNPTEFKRLKFVFQKGYENWACISELGLYKEDTVSNKMRELFTNGLMMEVSPKYDSLEAINELEAEVKNHPLKENYLEDIKLAKEIIKNKDLFKDTRVVTGEQRGKYLEESSKRSINGAAYTSFESVGKYVTPGEEIVVYLDADSTGVLPRLFIGQIARNKGDWKRLIDLKPGKNVIKVPNDINPAALYLFNDAGPSDQAYAPRIRVEGGTKFPIYFHGETDPEVFFKELQEYAKNIEYSDEAFANGNPSGKVFNIAEFVSENVVITTTAKGAIAGLTEAGKQGYNIADTMDGWEDLYDMFQYYLGFEEDAVEEKDSYFPNKFIARGFLGVPHAYAAHGYTGYSGSDNLERDGYFFPLLAMPPQMKGNDDWAYAHEFGHIFNTKHIVHGEVSNNLFAQEFRRLKDIKGDRVNWNGLMKRFQGEEVSLGFWENLGVLSQLDMAYGYDAYAKASKAVRDYPEVITSIEGSGLRRIAVAYSLGVGENLLDFFEGWNYTDVTPQMEEAVKDLPKPNRKIEYLHGGAYDYAGNGFSEDVVVTVSSKLDPNTKTNLLKFEIDDKNQSDLLGYEILKDGQVIGFTKDSSFTVKNENVEENEIYEVVAYAKNLTTAKAVSTNSFAPTLQVQQDKLTLKLHETFNSMDYIKGLTNQGQDITTRIEVTSNVDTSLKGVYEVRYTLVDKGISVEKVVEVEVVSEYDYLSDNEWQEATTQWSTPRRNNNIKGRVNGETKVFKNGFGIHANGKIVYDLSNKNYDQFEALVGVDMGIEAQGNSSIVFKIIGDGRVLATTKVMKHADNMAYINVPIKGVSELVIEVGDGGNGISSDHGIIANPKLTTNNVRPTIAVEEITYIKLNDTFDILSGVVANDQEDGNLLSQVKVNANGFTTSKTGEYNVTYTVVDSDGNISTKERTIVVYSEVNYLSDRKWESARTDYGSVNKDKASVGNTIKLGVEGEVRTFKKGIGTHANSEIIYDLSDLTGPLFFETYVGVDKNITEQNNSSIIFKILGDGKELYNSGLMKWDSAAKHVKLNLTGVTKLEIIVDNAGNGNASDHGSFGDAKFLVLDAAPSLEIPKDEAIKVGEYLEDIYGTYTATDAEDGDLTAQVEVSGMVNFKQPGRYTITYKVTDSDGNEVTKTREIAVVDMEDFTYLSDYNWASASCGWGSIKKDRSPSDNTIRLTDRNGQEVQFEKGLGTHARSVIKYDLTDKEAEYFSAYVGVDRAMYGSIASVAFEVWLDGEKVAETDVIHSRDAMEYLEVNIAGAKELMIVATDGGNGNGSDHAVWADAKLHYANPNNVKIDKTNLGELVTTVEGLPAHVYTQASWQNLLPQLQIAKEVMVNKEVTQEEVDLAVEKLQLAVDKLEISKGKEGLYELLQVAHTMEKENYTEEADWATFEEMREFYDNLYWSESVHDEVMYELVIEYFGGLIQSIEAYRIQGINQTDLQNLIATIEGLQAHIYTQASWQNLLPQLQMAKEVMVNEEATQEEVDLAVENLQLAVDQLEISKGKQGFYELLQVANTMEKNNYSEEAEWVTFEEMRAYYNDLYWAPSAHTEEIYAVVVEYFSDLIAHVESYRITNGEIEQIEIEKPEVEVPEVEVPEIEVPEVEVPEVEAPEVEAPEVEAPEVEQPELEQPELEQL